MSRKEIISVLAYEEIRDFQEYFYRTFSSRHGYLSSLRISTSFSQHQNTWRLSNSRESITPMYQKLLTAEKLFIHTERCIKEWNILPLCRLSNQTVYETTSLHRKGIMLNTVFEHLTRPHFNVRSRLVISPIAQSTFILYIPYFYAPPDIYISNQSFTSFSSFFLKINDQVK